MSVLVYITVKASDGKEADRMTTSLTADKINKELENAGLPKASMKQAPTATYDSTSPTVGVGGDSTGNASNQSTTNIPIIIGAVVGGASLVLCILSACYYFRRWKSKHPPDNAPIPSPSLPKNWKYMAAPWQDVELVEVPISSAEFKDVAAIFHTTCSKHEWLIAKVERVQNLPQWQLYQMHRRMIESRRDGRGANEKRLFHGTDKDTIPKINRTLFNRSFCGKNGTVYGMGVYFARDASYSIQDSYSRPDNQGNKYMYLARVVVGDFCEGKVTMTVPPPVPRTSNLLYDSTVDTLNQPSIYVIHHDAQAYPEYLITILRR